MITPSLKMVSRQNIACPDTKVEVKWDPAPDIEWCEETTTGEQSLLSSKLNKDNKEGAWRGDVDIKVRDELEYEIMISRKDWQE